MLQQTQVSRVLPKYREFLKRFPSLRSLASAKTGELLKAWSGLGYNRRALYLKRTAQTIQHEYRGEFPKNMQALQKLPGIGPTTAAAVACFAFGLPTPPVDINLFRVSRRHLFPKARVPQDVALLLTESKLVPRTKAREFFWALLDVGAQVCAAQKCTPACPFYPPRTKGTIASKVQSRFHGSNRFFRGQILKLLLQHNTLTLSQVNRKLRAHYKGKLPDIKSLIEQIAKEGLIRIKRDPLRITLP